VVLENAFVIAIFTRVSPESAAILTAFLGSVLIGETLRSQEKSQTTENRYRCSRVPLFPLPSSQRDVPLFRLKRLGPIRQVVAP
jgi:hypothetical protein